MVYRNISRQNQSYNRIKINKSLKKEIDREIPVKAGRFFLSFKLGSEPCDEKGSCSKTRATSTPRRRKIPKQEQRQTEEGMERRYCDHSTVNEETGERGVCRGGHRDPGRA